MIKDMSTELPSGWAEASLGELATKLVDGSHNPPKEAETGFPMLSARNIDCGQIQFTKYRYILEQDFKIEHARTQVSPGDVLLTIVGTIGRTAVVPIGMRPFALQRSVAVIAPKGVTPEFLKLQIDSLSIQSQLEYEAKGTAQKGIYLKALAGIRMRVAPLNEQRRIVAKIEELTDRSRRAREALDAVPALLDRFRQSVLAAAFRGDLTAEWRAKNPDMEPASVLLDRVRHERRRKWEEDLRAKGKDPRKAVYNEPESVDAVGLPELPEGWCWSTLDQLLYSLRNGIATKPDEADGLAILRISAVRPLSVNVRDVRYLPDGADFQDYLLQERDLLFTRYNGNPELVGVCGMVRYLDAATVYPDKLIRGRTIQGLVAPEFIELAVNTGTSRAAIASKTKTAAGQVGISGGDLRLTPVPLPPLAEQVAIGEIVQGLLRQERAARGATKLAEGRLDHLDQSILAKAFRGELVPQDPNDEPASVLLERIRGERAEAVVPKARRGRKPRELTEAKG